VLVHGPSVAARWDPGDEARDPSEPAQKHGIRRETIAASLDVGPMFSGCRHSENRHREQVF